MPLGAAVTGMYSTTAQQTIRAAGLSVSTAQVVDNTCEHLNQVLSQQPAAGTRVTAGSTVTITVGKAPGPPHMCR